MAIKVYILKKSIMKSSIDEYLEMKAELKERKKLEKQMSGAFANFVRTGKPYEDTLPEWPACEVGKENTMIFDKVSRVRVNHDDEMMETFRPMHIAPGLFG